MNRDDKSGVRGRKKSWTLDKRTQASAGKPKRGKFDFEIMKAAATHDDIVVRKQAFIEYYERFQEFPSYLFDNEVKIDAKLYATVQALLQDVATSPEMVKDISALLHRLPS